ncbi:MAG: hypothetical protein Tsb0021_06310 [Chlamydiales bacterium]
MKNNILFLGPRQTDLQFLNTENMTVVRPKTYHGLISKKDIPSQREVVVTLCHLGTKILNGEKTGEVELLEYTEDFALTFGEEIAGEINFINGCAGGGGAYSLYKMKKSKGLYIISGSSKTYLSKNHLLTRINKQIKNCLSFNSALRNSIHESITQHFVMFFPEGKIHFKLRTPKTPYLQSVKNLNLDEFWKTSLTENKDHFLKIIAREGIYKEEVIKDVKEILLNEIERQSGETHQSYLNQTLFYAVYEKRYEIVDGQRTTVVIEVGNLEKIKILLEKGAQINARLHMGETALHAAAVGGNVEIFRFLLEQGADITIKTDTEQTVLMAAATEGHLKIVQEILAHNKVDINARDYIGSTACLFASNNGNTAILEELIKHGVDVNIRTNDGSSPLLVAAQNGCINCVLKLLPKVKYLNFQKEDGETAAHAAARNGHLYILNSLKDAGLDFDIEDNEGRTPWFTLLENGHVTGLHDSYQIHLKKSKHTGRTALHFAANEGRLGAVEWLIEKGADINAIEMVFKRSPLHFATMSESLETVSFLILKGAEINLQDINGFSPLHIACLMGLEDTVSCLINNKAELNLKSDQGYTPLHYSAANGNVNLVKILLEKDADKNTLASDNSTPLSDAKKYGFSEIVSLLEK